MDIQNWFNSSGSFKDGVLLYSKLPTSNPGILRSFAIETSTNFLRLKYELKKAIECGYDTTDSKVNKVEYKPIAVPKKEPLLNEIIKASEKEEFDKESMADYPMELHSTYRERIENFYLACELKFKLNAIPKADEEAALNIIIQLEDLWTKIDRAWLILDHWKDHNRLMPTKESEDFSKLSPVQIVMKRNRLETSISKRSKTIRSMELFCEKAPEDRQTYALLQRKKGQLQQIIIDLETIKSILKNE